MKEVTTILIVLILVVTGNVITEKYMSKSSEHLISDIGDLKKSLKEGIDNSQKMEKIYKDWESTRTKWSMLAEHKHLDEVDLNLLSAKTSIEEDEKATAAEGLDKAIFLLNDIKDKYSLKLINVF